MENLEEIWLAPPYRTIVAVDAQVPIEAMSRRAPREVVVVLDTLENTAELVVAGTTMLVASFWSSDPREKSYLQLRSPVIRPMLSQSLWLGRTAPAALITDEPPRVAPRG